MNFKETMMKMIARILALLIAYLTVLPATGATPGTCQEAHDLLVQAVAAPAPESAPALDAALRGCPATQNLIGDRGDPAKAAFVLDLTRSILALQMPASQCGYATKTTGSSPDTMIAVSYQVAFYGPQTDYDHGPALATFEPHTGVTSYEAQGATYGLTANSQNVGIIKVLGVSLPATRAAAYAGCTDTNATLCWASGMAMTTLEGEVTLMAYSRFNQC
jgi:hypothetical protein